MNQRLRWIIGGLSLALAGCSPDSAAPAARVKTKGVNE
jgi:hypothetical protein